MPGVSGPDVAHAARRAQPDMPIVLMTGYADARTLVEPLPPRVVLLKKPFSPLRTDSLPLVSKMYWRENANDAIMDAP